MDAKITLSFDGDVISKAKIFAEKNKVSLSRITEIFWSKMIDQDSATIDALPVSDWALELIGKDPIYVPKTAKTYQYEEYYESRYNVDMVAEDDVHYEITQKKSKK
jgi:Family of unknown function (DUF6364)